MNLAGLPPTTVHGSTSLKTEAVAPTTAPSPIVTPIQTNALAATQALFPITMGAVTSECLGSVISCDAVQRKLSCDTTTLFPIIIGALLYNSVFGPMQLYCPTSRFQGAYILHEGYTRDARGILAPNNRRMQFRNCLKGLPTSILNNVAFMIAHTILL